MESMARPPRSRHSSARRVTTLKTLRSRVTNGKTLFVDSDQRGPWARRWRDVLAEVLNDVSAGDADRLSEAQRQLARRCATISVQCEKMEGEAALGNDIDLEQYGTLTDRLGRALQRLGIKRQIKSAKDITPPSVEAYLKHKATISGDLVNLSTTDKSKRTSNPKGAAS
jgi:hypothetical protein